MILFARSYILPTVGSDSLSHVPRWDILVHDEDLVRVAEARARVILQDVLVDLSGGRDVAIQGS